MKVLGYIVSKTKMTNILPCIQVVSNYNSIEDNSKPILIIGLEEAKKYASSFSILEKKIGDKLFWTFGKREKRNDYEKDIDEFQDFVLKNVINDIKYYYFNLLTCKIKKIKTLLSIIKNNDGNTLYIDKKMIYLYRENYVIGISCEILDYIGVKKDKIIQIIKSNANNKVFFNDFLLNYKMKSMTNDKKYIIPFFLSLKIIK